jgi:hypothetical protein
MRRFAGAIAVLSAAVLAPASAQAASADFVGAPLTHGPDPAAVARGPESPPVPVVLAKRSGGAAKVAPPQWCGDELTADDTAHEVDNGAYRYHAIYMIAADGADRFSARATGIQTDAFQASSLLESSYGRAIRFDLGTSCGPQYLDISVVRTAETSAQLRALASTPNGTYDATVRALDAAGFQTIQPDDTVEEAGTRTRNYVVWLDAPTPGGSCGQAAIYDDPSRADGNLNNLGGKVAVVFRNGDGFCSSNAARHEIGHNLGALQPVAPHAFDGAHCNDAYEDTMCYSNSPIVADGNRGTFFDYHNDDYWSLPGKPLPWWTVDENRFLCPDATCNFVGPDAPAEPTPPIAPITPASAPPPPARPRIPRATVRLHARKHRHGVWHVSLRATGSGHGVVVVRCRQRHHGQVRSVLVRRTSLPRTLHGSVRCVASRPRAKLLLLKRR